MVEEGTAPADRDTPATTAASAATASVAADPEALPAAAGDPTPAEGGAGSLLPPVAHGEGLDAAPAPAPEPQSGPPSPAQADPESEPDAGALQSAMERLSQMTGSAMPPDWTPSATESYREEAEEVLRSRRPLGGLS